MTKSTDNHNRLVPPHWLIVILVACVLAWLLAELKEVLVLLVVGYCIAYVIDPLLEWLEKRKIRRSIGFFVVLLSACVFGLLVLLTAVPTLVDEYHRLLGNLPDYWMAVKDKAIDFSTSAKSRLPASIAVRLKDVVDNIPVLGLGSANKLIAKLLSALLQGYSLTLTLLNLTLLPFIVFYLSVSFPTFHAQILQMIPQKIAPKVKEVFSEIDIYISAFVRGQILVGIILSCLYAIGLGMVGIELWFLLALISGIGNIVPYFGLLIGIFLSSIMAVVTYGDFWHLALVWIVYGVVQFLEGIFITPRIMGEKVGLSPLTIILAIFASGKLFGLLGIFLAVPLAAIVKVLLKHSYVWWSGKLQES